MAAKEFDLFAKIRVYVYEIDGVVFKMKKTMRPVLGDDIRHLSYSLITESNMANSSCASQDMPDDLIVSILKERVLHIDKLLASIKTLSFLLDMAQDKKYISEKANSRLIQQSVTISRMAIAWSRQTKTRLISMTCGGQ